MASVSRFGDHSLLITDYEEEGIGRDWVTQSPATGDQHTLQDRGRGLHRTRCKITFCDEPTGATFEDRWLAFRLAAAAAQAQLFVHPDPNVGTYQAVVADLTAQASGEERCVRVSCIFIETTAPKPVTPVGAGTAVAAGPEAVGARAATATTELGAVGVTSSVPASCLAAVTAWSAAAEPNARAIALEASALATRIDALLASLTEPRQWGAYRAVIVLRYAVTCAASAVTSETSRVSSFTLVAAEPLLSLCARKYGAGEAQDRARQVAKLNGLRTPSLVPAGTTLKLPAVKR